MKIVFLALFNFCFLSLTFAQMDPVQWTFECHKIQNNEYEITFTADIRDGWSIYSQFLPSGGPIPTKITFTENSSFQLIGQADELGLKEEIFDTNYGFQLTKFKNKAKLKQKIMLIDANTKVLRGQITYMSCNENGCIPPKDVQFEVPVQE